LLTKSAQSVKDRVSFIPNPLRDLLNAPPGRFWNTRVFAQREGDGRDVVT
jgi:hypothetical protein